MLADRYDLPVSTASAAARDAYVQGYELALTLYPGAVEAFDRALAADPGLAIAHVGKAQILMREGKAAQARAALAAARDLAAGVSAREAGHIRFFDLAFSGRTEDAIDALSAHRPYVELDIRPMSRISRQDGKRQLYLVSRPS